MIKEAKCGWRDKEEGEGGRTDKEGDRKRKWLRNMMDYKKKKRRNKKMKKASRKH